jgi:hypothetical protein
MVGVLAMAAAAAPPPVKDYEIEVRSSFCQVPFFWSLGGWWAGWDGGRRSQICIWEGRGGTR